VLSGVLRRVVWNRNSVEEELVKANELTIRRLLQEAWNEGRLDVLDELVAFDAVPSNSTGPSGPETWKKDIEYYRDHFGDLVYSARNVISTDEFVVLRWLAEGRDSVGIRGRPPTGLPVVFTGITIYRFKNGKIVEHWAEIDMAGLLERLGILGQDA
jgi:predicted ester cyclase